MRRLDFLVVRTILGLIVLMEFHVMRRGSGKWLERLDASWTDLQITRDAVSCSVKEGPDTSSLQLFMRSSHANMPSQQHAISAMMIPVLLFHAVDASEMGSTKMDEISHSSAQRNEGSRHF